MKTLVFLPTYNEKNNILPLIDEILKTSRRSGIEIDILVIDDNSPDGTAEVVRSASVIYDKNIYLIVRSGKLGLGTALKQAISFSYKHDYDIMVLMDADFQHPPETIPPLVNNVVEGYDLVIASRYVLGGGVEEWSFVRRIISRGANYYVKMILNLPVKDSTSGFRAFSKRALAYLSSEYFFSRGYALQVEIAYKLWKRGFKLKEIPFLFGVRRSGSSKLDFKIIIEFFFNVYRLRKVI